MKYFTQSNGINLTTSNTTTLTEGTGISMSLYETIGANGTSWVYTVGLDAVLNDLNDVTITTVATNNTLTYNGTAWINTPFTIENLNDVDTSLASDGHVLVYGSGTWISMLPTLGLIDDIAIASPSLGEFLVYNGTHWVNTEVVLEDISNVASGALDGQVLVFNDSISKWIPTNTTLSGNIIYSNVSQHQNAATGQVVVRSVAIGTEYNAEGNIIDIQASGSLVHQAGYTEYIQLYCNGSEVTNISISSGSVWYFDIKARFIVGTGATSAYVQCTNTVSAAVTYDATIFTTPYLVAASWASGELIFEIKATSTAINTINCAQFTATYLT